jgi:deoxyadenosine/deoxycytidine kinase
MHIAVAGNIGSGKTTLTRLLSEHYGWEPKYEDVDVNPYLSDFYNDMQRWSFNLQIYFLNKRMEGIVDIQNSSRNVIQDRTIYEDARIFASNLHSMGLLSTRDFENYRSLFELMISLVKPPDLLIYLKSSIPTLIYQINKRGREYESGIRTDYLEGLNKRYDEWFANYEDGKKLVINVDELKFEDNPQDLQTVIELINKECGL